MYIGISFLKLFVAMGHDEACADVLKDRETTENDRLGVEPRLFSSPIHKKMTGGVSP